MSETVRVGLIGTGFIRHIHTMSLHAAQHAELVAVASKTPGKAVQFAEAHDISDAYED